MELLIVNQDIVNKLNAMSFGQYNILIPYKSELNGVAVYWLPSDVKTYPPFAKALADFKVCLVKDIATIEEKTIDSKGVITTDPTKIVATKTILTEKLIEPIK